MGSTFYTKRYDPDRTTRVKRNRPKTFKTKEALDKWAKENKITNYTIENLKSPENKEQKLRIVLNK